MLKIVLYQCYDFINSVQPTFTYDLQVFWSHCSFIFWESRDHDSVFTFVCASWDLINIDFRSFDSLSLSRLFPFIFLSCPETVFTCHVNYCTLVGLWSVHICACMVCCCDYQSHPHFIVFLKSYFYWSIVVWIFLQKMKNVSCYSFKK